MALIILDTDVGLDDAAAILLAKNEGICPDYYICTGGNTSANGVVRNVFILNKYLGLNAKIVKGCEVDPGKSGDFYGADGFADLSQKMMEEYHISKDDIKTGLSYDALKKKLLRCEHITYVAIGPLSTLADLISDEDIRDRIDHVYIMGGGIKEFNSSFDTEFNFHLNPEAVNKVFSAGLDLTLFPLDLTIHQNIDEKQINALADTGNYPEYIEMFRFIREKTLEYDHIDAAILHDTMPILYLAYPEKFSIIDVKIKCDINGHLAIADDGKTVHLAAGVNASLLYDCLKSAFRLK